MIDSFDNEWIDGKWCVKHAHRFILTETYDGERDFYHYNFRCACGEQVAEFKSKDEATGEELEKYLPLFKDHLERFGFTLTLPGG